MKEREFELKNYSISSIMKDIIKQDLESALLAIKHPFIMKDSKIAVIDNYKVTQSMMLFEELSKKDQVRVEKVAKEQYVVAKTDTINDFKKLKKECDTIFFDDKQYLKLLPTLDELYYCQAHTILEDFKDAKLGSRAIANSVYRARALQTSIVMCD